MPSKLDELRFFLLDMDGTVYLGPNPIPGAAGFLRSLRESGRRFLFLTNNPTSDAARYADKLRGMGMDARPEDVADLTDSRALDSRPEWREWQALGRAALAEGRVAVVTLAAGAGSRWTLACG